MSDDNTTFRMERSISLNKLKPNEYRLWVIQTEATFEVHKCLDIVLGVETNPTPVDDDGRPIGPIGKLLQSTIASWQTRHALAREALLKSLEPADMLKVIAYKNSAPAIWNRLKNEYGKPLDFEYIRVNSEYMSLRKEQNTTMDAHITRFNQLLQEVEYNKPSTIPPNEPEAVNLQFMLSLGESWETFSLAKGEWPHRVSTAELHAVDRAMVVRKTKPATQSSTPTEGESGDASSSGNDGNKHTGSNRSDYQPSFVPPSYRHSANTLNFIAKVRSSVHRKLSLRDFNFP